MKYRIAAQDLDTREELDALEVDLPGEPTEEDLQHLALELANRVLDVHPDLDTDKLVIVAAEGTTTPKVQRVHDQDGQRLALEDRGGRQLTLHERWAMETDQEDFVPVHKPRKRET